jgi:predicted phage terminase large subunit-like protein
MTMSNTSYYDTLLEYLNVLEKKHSNKNRIEALGYKQRMGIVNDLQGLVMKNMNDGEAQQVLVERVIPYISRIIRYENNIVNVPKQMDILKELYKVAAKRSLRHFVLYYEWDWDEKSKFLEPRQDILSGYCHYLEKMVLDETFLNLVTMLPSGYGKSRLLKYAEAWSFGVNNTGSILAICSNDFLIRSMSRTVMDIIQSKEFGDVFPHMDYAKNAKMFTKETDKEWRLATCALVNSYMAISRDSNAVGLRASAFISLDDMYTDFNEALDNDLNKRLWNKYITVFRERFVKGRSVKLVAVGTKWSAFDLLSQIEEDLQKSKEFVPDEKYPYVMVSTDGTSAIIKVPALDENGQTTCPKLISTEELNDKKSKIPSYLWLCNYQQESVPPEGLEFDYNLLNTYSSKLQPNEVCYASLDPARKGKNFVSMPIFTKLPNEGETAGKYALIDAMFKKNAMTELYDEIVMKVKKNRIIKLIVENNTDTSLPYVIQDKLKEAGVFFCEVVPIYSYQNKEQRIKDYQGILRENIVFPERGLFPIVTDVGKLMEQLTSYSFNFPNKYDDGIDSVTLFTMYQIADVGKSTKAVAIDRRAMGL